MKDKLRKLNDLLKSKELRELRDKYLPEDSLIAKGIKSSEKVRLKKFKEVTEDSCNER